MNMAFVTRIATPFCQLLRVNNGGRGWMTIGRAISNAPFVSSFNVNSIQKNSSCLVSKRFFSESPHEFFPRILKDYKPSTENISKEALISELKTTKVSFERGKVILMDLLYLKAPFTASDMETIIQANMKMKNYIRVVSFADYCFTNNLMPEITETTADYILYSCAELHDGSILKYIPRYLPNYIQEKYAFKSKLLRSYYTCHKKEEGDSLLSLFERNQFRFSDCNNNILDGLCEGGYYSQCIEIYKKIEAAMNNAPTDNPIRLYHRGYFAVLKSYCKLGDEGQALRFIQIIKDHNLYLNDECYFYLCELYDTSKHWQQLSQKVFDVFQKKQVPISDVQKRIITARAKEVQYRKGVELINEYCETHGSLLNIDKKEKRLVIQCQNLPSSACRMRILKLFADINKTYRYQDFDEMTVALRVTQEQPEVIRLLEKDLFPPIRYQANGLTLTLNNEDILKWLDRKGFNFEYFN